MRPLAARYDSELSVSSERAAAVEVDYGKGRVVLLGFKPQWRAQSHGTYKFLFDQLYTQAGR